MALCCLTMTTCPNKQDKHLHIGKYTSYSRRLVSTVQTCGENEELPNEDKLIMFTQYFSSADKPVISTRVWDEDTSTVLQSVY